METYWAGPKKCSSAIHTALDHYNATALALNPPWPALKWDEVVEYAFLSDFDLLHDAHQDIQHLPWATPAGHLAMDTHFKLLHAHEEIDCLNVKIRHVATHIWDEDHYLCTCKETSHLTDLALAQQILVHCMLRGHFKAHHKHCLQSIAKMPRFTGTIVPGKSMDTGDGACAFIATNSHPLDVSSGNGDASAGAAKIDDERVGLEQEAEDNEDYGEVPDSV